MWILGLGEMQKARKLQKLQVALLMHCLTNFNSIYVELNIAVNQENAITQPMLLILVAA